MKIFDQSVSRATALKLKEFLEEATAICRAQSKHHAHAVLESGKVSQDIAEAETASTSTSLDCSYYDHIDCVVYTLEDFTEMVDKYANANPVSAVLTDSELVVVQSLNDPEIAMKKAPDAFLLVGKPVEVFAKTDDAKSAARETAWKELKMIADVFAVYARLGCEGSQRTSQEVSAHISKTLQELTATNAGKNLQEGRDFERLSL